MWDDVKPTQPDNPKSKIPKSFELDVNGEKIWVNPNATKHMVEYSRRKVIPEGEITESQKITEQQLLTSLRAAVKEAMSRGYTYEVPIRIDNWELIFSSPRRVGQLPVLIHARYIP
ncbi:hypothetical protein VZE42_01650 [Lactiplantibacillus plantarum]|nr:hemagglutinin [Lactiplantibacillus plantarum]WVI00573.1 hypothetical protein VZE42_01650 [Lactiplantibacillus plantarum]